MYYMNLGSGGTFHFPQSDLIITENKFVLIKYIYYIITSFHAQLIKQLA